MGARNLDNAITIFKGTILTPLRCHYITTVGHLHYKAQIFRHYEKCIQAHMMEAHESVAASPALPTECVQSICIGHDFDRLMGQPLL